MAITEKQIVICGHGSGTPSTKNMYDYLTSRYNSIASNGLHKGIISVRRLKALTDSGRQKFHDTYKTILRRNLYNQNYRDYVYSPRSDGKYYSDCSSSGCATYRKIGYSVSNLNTAGIYRSSLFEDVPVTIVNGHIMNPEILKVGDALLFVGNDPSRPKQIGHVEFVYEMPVSSHSYKTTSITTANSGMKVLATLNIRKEPVSGDRVSTYASGTIVKPTERTSLIDGTYWFKTNQGWISGKYLTGWVKDNTTNQWWYNEHGIYPTNQWKDIDGQYYYFGHDGYMVSEKYVKSSSKNVWYWLSKTGSWDTTKDVTVKPSESLIYT